MAIADAVAVVAGVRYERHGAALILVDADAERLVMRRQFPSAGLADQEFERAVAQARRLEGAMKTRAQVAASVQVGDVVPIVFSSWANGPKCFGRVVAVDGRIAHFVYTAESEMFCGLRGMLRLPGWTKGFGIVDERPKKTK